MMNLGKLGAALDKLPPYVVSGVVVVAIMLLTLLPDVSAPEDFPLFENADKVIHALMFGGLSTVLWWDESRRRGERPARYRVWVVVCIVSVLFGGLIEVAQSVMGVGRSGDVLDLVADAVGAVLLPLLFRPIVNLLIPKDMIRLVDGKCVPEEMLAMERIYIESFPPEERREWSDIVCKAEDENHPLTFNVVRRNGKGVGFITAWSLPEVTYVEHFAINPAERGGGIGSKAIAALVTKSDRPVVLEVELPSVGEDARRRIEFYKRCGFVAHEAFEYVQPPYAPGLSEVPLMLMTSEPGVNLEAAAESMKRVVYGV